MAARKQAAEESQRERDLKAMIKKAQANPGVREAMEVYQRAQGVSTQVHTRLSTPEQSLRSSSDRTSL